MTDKSDPYLAEIVSYGNLLSLQLGAMEKPTHVNKLTELTFEAISESNRLHRLGMNDCVLSPKKPPPGVKSPTGPTAPGALTRMLSRSTSLRMLRLSDCQLSVDTMHEVIASGLRFSAKLTHLDMSCNRLDIDNGVLLSQALLKPVLEWVQRENEADYAHEGENPLHLFLPRLEPQPVAVGFAAVLSSYPFLGYLDLSNNTIDDGVTAIASALETNQTIVELHLAENRFTSVGGKALSQSLRVNQTLPTLNISRNNLGDDTACEIADALQRNTVLTVLLIASAWLSDQGGIRLAKASRYCPSLITLDMSDNFFTEDAGTAMENLFGENLTILKSDVSGTQINHFSFHAINNICARNAEIFQQKKQRPLRNQLIKSQYSLVEFERKEAILANLVN
jgi:Ran GTPase-activating protein (RanGAP) involved in mRNA processing and transport